jgi:hypothetical protein
MNSDEYINDISKRIFANTKYIIGTDNEKYENVNATNVRTLIKNKNDDYKNYLPDCISKFILNNKKSAT